MDKYKLGEMEQRFADLIWEKAPMKTRALIELGKVTFQWQRTTTYTMLKRLCDRGLFINVDGEVKVLMSREAFLEEKGDAFIQESFNGSLPSFLAAFTRRKRLSEKEIQALQRLIDEHKE